MERTVKARIQEDMKSAMRAKEKNRLGTIRLLLAAIKQDEIDKQITLSDGEILKIINKMIKQRRESISQFELANRMELVQQEQSEIDVLSTYLPTPLSTEAVQQIIENTLQETQAASMRDMGTVMAQLKPKLEGLTDMAAVSAIIKEKLNQ